VGAWIETIERQLNQVPIYVAPRVGAWIETIIGLTIAHQIWVAPRVGAWIETNHPPNTPIKAESHPVWVRGLKQSQCLKA